MAEIPFERPRAGPCGEGPRDRGSRHLPRPALLNPAGLAPVLQVYTFATR